jgi:uncharacterized Zn finger protein
VSFVPFVVRKAFFRRAKYYHHAISWLTRARMAYQAAGREADWRAYLAEIRARHGRKYKLMRMLEGFG